MCKQIGNRIMFRLLLLTITSKFKLEMKLVISLNCRQGWGKKHNGVTNKIVKQRQRFFFVTQKNLKRAGIREGDNFTRFQVFHFFLDFWIAKYNLNYNLKKKMKKKILLETYIKSKNQLFENVFFT